MLPPELSTDLRDVPHWVANAAIPSSSTRTLDVTDSASGEVCARLTVADRSLVDATVAVAADAAGEWGRASVAARTRVLFRFRELVAQNAGRLAALVTEEHGKVRGDALAEIARGLDVVDFACGIGQLLKAEMSTEVSTAIDAYSRREPLGVVTGITPFNFPAMVPMWMFPIALAAGNAFILKPSEQDPSASVLMAELLAEAGLPPGVFSVLHGDRDTVEALLTHDGIAAASFVGSTAVARQIFTTGTAFGKRVQALGGAKNHAVVLPDADLGSTADAVVSAAFGSTGQRCMAVSVAVTVGAIADALVEAVSDRIGAITVGPGTDERAEMGPLISARHRDRVASLVTEGVADGAELVVDGRGLTVAGHEGGHFIGPCLLDRVAPGMSVYDQEIFGPVLTVVRCDTFEDALALVNGNPYGNGASVFTRDGGAARAFERAVTAGMVGINVPIPVPVAYHSFGGWKDSLFGDLHMHGPDGVRFYTKGRATTVRWPDPGTRGVDLGFPANR